MAETYKAVADIVKIVASDKTESGYSLRVITKDVILAGGNIPMQVENLPSTKYNIEDIFRPALEKAVADGQATMEPGYDMFGNDTWEYTAVDGFEFFITGRISNEFPGVKTLIVRQVQ